MFPENSFLLVNIRQKWYDLLAFNSVRDEVALIFSLPRKKIITPGRKAQGSNRQSNSIYFENDTSASAKIIKVLIQNLSYLDPCLENKGHFNQGMHNRSLNKPSKQFAVKPLKHRFVTLQKRL
jgi:hypothetical protein